MPLASRRKVHEVVRGSTSIWPVFNAVRRCWPVNGTKRTLVPSPSTAIAMARQVSTSSPFQLPSLSGAEKPVVPWPDPQIT
ncbi:hypothetical protein D3C78_1688510 [compost metagenome]